MHNQFVWVDIPVADLERAMAFYSAVLDAEMTVQSFAGFVSACCLTTKTLSPVVFTNPKIMTTSRHPPDRCFT